MKADDRNVRQTRRVFIVFIEPTEGKRKRGHSKQLGGEQWKARKKREDTSGEP